MKRIRNKSQEAVEKNRKYAEEYRKRKLLEDPIGFKALNRLSTYKRAAANKNLISQLKQQPCQDCGKTYPECCMQFDHRVPSLKEHNVADMVYGYSQKSLQKEIDKCDILCANCHCMRTDLLRNSL